MRRLGNAIAPVPVQLASHGGGRLGKRGRHRFNQPTETVVQRGEAIVRRREIDRHEGQWLAARNGAKQTALVRKSAPNGLRDVRPGVIGGIAGERIRHHMAGPRGIELMQCRLHHKDWPIG